ncbi:hypothetical protein ACWDN9_33855, partial [Streptomyces nigra]
MIVAGVALVGPSAPSGAVFARALPVDAAESIVPNRVMTWNLCNPCGVSDVDRAAEIATYAPQVIGVQEACDRDVARIRDFLEGYYGLKYHVAYGTVLDSLSRCGGSPWNPGGFGVAEGARQALLDVAHNDMRQVADTASAHLREI